MSIDRNPVAASAPLAPAASFRLLSAAGKSKLHHLDACVRASSNGLMLIFVLLPALNALGAARQSGTIPLGVLTPVSFGVFLLALAASFVTLSTKAIRGAPVFPRASSGVAIAGSLLIAWLALREASTGNTGGARNYLLVLMTGLLLHAGRTSGFQPVIAFRFACRAAVLLSGILYVLYPTWYVNASDFFIDSGKIFSTVPNVQGIFGHPNYTGLFFSAVTLEEILVSAGRPVWRIFYGTSSAVILVMSQARNANIGAILALIIVGLIVHRRRTIVQALFFGGILLVASLPLLFSLPYFLSATAPNFSALSLLGTRSSVWTAVDYFIARAPLFGGGSPAIIAAHAIIVDPDVTDITHAHNLELNILVSGGLVGLVMYFLTFVEAFRASLIRPQKSSLATGLLTVWAFSTFSESPLTPYVTQVGVVLYVVIGLLLVETVQACPRVRRGSDGAS